MIGGFSKVERSVTVLIPGDEGVTVRFYEMHIITGIGNEGNGDLAVRVHLSLWRSDLRR